MRYEQPGFTGGQLDDQLIIDISDAEAFLVRKDADTGDIFTIDTALSNVLVDARLKMGTSQPFWPAVGKAAGIQFLGTAATRAGIIYDTDEGMSLVAGDNDGNGNHVVSLISGGNILKDHDSDTFETNPLFKGYSATDPDTDNTEHWKVAHDGTDTVFGSGKGGIKIDGVRFKSVQGADVASAHNLTLGTDGNTFEITGTTQVNLIDNAGWFNGNKITLYFTSTPTVKHGQATSGDNTTILLDSSADAALTAGSRLELQLSEVGGVQAWRETGRTFV